MKTYKVVKATRIQKEGEEFDYYNLTLATPEGSVVLTNDNDGKRLDHTIKVSSKFIQNLFKQEQVNIDVLTPLEMQMLIKGMGITCQIDLKKVGDTFVATEFTEQVSTDKGKTWVAPKVGEKYPIVHAGFRLDYNEPVFIDFNSDLARKFEREAVVVQ